jgi:hypothetical protein
MKKRLASPLGAALCLVAVHVGVAATAVRAHEERATGAVHFVVGWGEEPAYTGSKNSVEITVSDAGGRPVTDLGNGLKVEVIKGSERVTLPLEGNFGGSSGTPGTYRAWLTPTRPGSYTFRLSGSARGESVDESFTSSPTTFDEVQDLANIQFPAKDPSNGQLATRLDREVPRLETRTEELEIALDEADERVDSAQMLAVVGVAVGALGLLAAVGALVTARRGRHGGGGPDVVARPARSEQPGSLSR